MTTGTKLSPALRRVLQLAAERKVWADPTRETVRWMLSTQARGGSQPITPAVQSLIDAGLLAADRDMAATIGTWCFATPTPAGRALLATLDTTPESES